jgi:hypothetical protein
MTYTHYFSRFRALPDEYWRARWKRAPDQKILRGGQCQNGKAGTGKLARGKVGMAAVHAPVSDG